MGKAVVVDTSVLPTWGSLSSSFWLTLRKVCELKGFDVCVPEIVIHESLSFRRVRFENASAEFVKSLREVSRFYDMEAAYVPDTEEILTLWNEELRSTFTVVPVDGDDAVKALEREATRTRPARGGRGARDSVIWMTVLRLAATHDTVLFVSSNTSDFGVGTNSHELHPYLAEEVSKTEGDILFFATTNELMLHLASSVAKPSLNTVEVAELVATEIRDRVYLEAQKTAEHPGLTARQLDADTVVLSEAISAQAFSVDGKGLALVKGKGTISVGDPADHNHIGLLTSVWVDYELATDAVVSGELASVDLT